MKLVSGSKRKQDFCSLVKWANKSGIAITDLIDELINESEGEVLIYALINEPLKLEIEICTIGGIVKETHFAKAPSGFYMLDESSIQVLKFGLHKDIKMGAIPPLDVVELDLININNSEELFQADNRRFKVLIKNEIRVSKEMLFIYSEAKKYFNDINLIADQNCKLEGGSDAISAYQATISSLKDENGALTKELDELKASTSYLDANNENYAPELALCVKVWNDIFLGNKGNKKEGVTTRVKNLLKSDYVPIENENLPTSFITRIAAVVNSKKAVFQKKNN